MTGWRTILLSVFLALLSFFIVLTADRQFEDPDKSPVISSIQKTFLPEGGRFILPLFNFDQSVTRRDQVESDLSEFEDLILTRQNSGTDGLKLRLPADRLGDNAETIARALAKRTADNDIQIQVMGHSDQWIDDLGLLADRLTRAGVADQQLSIGLSDGPDDYIDIIIAGSGNM